LDLRAQEAAQQSVREGLEKLESTNKKLSKLKTDSKKTIEGSLVSADPKTGEVKAIVGGRNFRYSQFNRAYQSKRQVGSVFKPLVYLAALEFGTDGQTPTPLTMLNDKKFTVKYEGQSWSPINYDKKERGEIPVFYALSRSLNIPTAQLGLSVGLERIVELAITMGVKAQLKPVPALALGAFEMTPLDVLQTYSILANFGQRIPLSLIRRIESTGGDLIYLNEPEASQVADPVNVAILVGMLKQTVINGTAWFLPKLGFTAPAAGKTGTTSDARDAWFAGMTPDHVAVAWVGYDDNTESGLTGASGAVPIWANYMMAATSHLPAVDFEWPEGTEPYTLSVDQLIDLNVPEENKRPLEPVELIFRAGTHP
jgi:penicillin-binding protein 1B